MGSIRWNSKAIFPLLKFILISKRRKELFVRCKFISHTWAGYWFKNHEYDKEAYEILSTLLKEYTKAHNTLNNFWNKELFKMSIPSSNQRTESGIKIMQEKLYKHCSMKKVLLRFILSNKNS